MSSNLWTVTRPIMALALLLAAPALAPSEVKAQSASASIRAQRAAAAMGWLQSLLGRSHAGRARPALDYAPHAGTHVPQTVAHGSSMAAWSQQQGDIMRSQMNLLRHGSLEEIEAANRRLARQNQLLEGQVQYGRTRQKVRDSERAVRARNHKHEASFNAWDAAQRGKASEAMRYRREADAWKNAEEEALRRMR